MIRHPHPVVGIGVGREVHRAQKIAALGVPAKKDSHVVLVVVRNQPLKSLLPEVHFPQLRRFLIKPVGGPEKRLGLAVDLRVQQIPIQLTVCVPLVPLADLRAHKQQFLSRMCQKVCVKSPEGEELIFIVAGHFAHQRPLHMYHLVMKEGQENIYYAAGETADAIDRLPQLETLKDAGTEVLYFSEDVDEFTAQTLMLRVGNFVPAISLEGFEEATDGRRGSGVFKKVTKAMELLRSKKLVYGISSCYTSSNYESITSEEFYDSLIDMLRAAFYEGTMRNG